MAKNTHVTVAETDGGKYIQSIQTRNHHLTADEPTDLGGQDKGPAPYDFLLAALGACTTMTLRMYADRKEWVIGKIHVDLTHHKDENRKDVIHRRIKIEGDMTDDIRARLLEIADKCPVHKTLEAGATITTQYAEEE